MSVIYDGRYSIDIYLGVDYGEDVSDTFKLPINTWTDLHLIPTSRPYIAIPQAAISLVSVPGSNRTLDLSELLSGGVNYGRRTGSWEFYIDADKWDNWRVCYDYLLDTLHGKKVGIVLSDSKRQLYNGRLTIGAYSPEESFSKVTINYDLFYEPVYLDRILLRSFKRVFDPPFAHSSTDNVKEFVDKDLVALGDLNSNSIFNFVVTYVKYTNNNILSGTDLGYSVYFSGQSSSASSGLRINNAISGVRGSAIKKIVNGLSCYDLSHAIEASPNSYVGTMKEIHYSIYGE